MENDKEPIKNLNIEINKYFESNKNIVDSINSNKFEKEELIQDNDVLHDILSKIILSYFFSAFNEGFNFDVGKVRKKSKGQILEKISQNLNFLVKILSNKKIDISSIGYNYFIDSIILKNKNEEETKSEKGKLLFLDPPYENVKSSNKVNYGTAQKKGKIKKDDKESCSIERVVKKIDEFINSNNKNIAVLTYYDSEILEKELGMCNLKFFK